MFCLTVSPEAQPRQMHQKQKWTHNQIKKRNEVLKLATQIQMNN